MVQRITPLSAKRTLYSDFFRDFTENPVSSDLARKTNEEAVKEAILNLLSTNKGERLFQPGLGGNIRALLFSNITPDVIITIREMVRETITNFEPRATLVGVDVTSTVDDNAVAVTVVFRVISTQNPITIETIISRTR